MKQSKKERINETKLNNQGCLMKIVEYNTYDDIIIEFQDEYKYRTHTTYNCFKLGTIRNPYFPSVFGVGIVGSKYPIKKNGKIIKEYYTWANMIERCYSKQLHKKRPTYMDCIVCKEWLLFENFYEWLHSQENFEKWLMQHRSALDKDILAKDNKFYSPDTCCLVPITINSLIVKCDSARGNNPIGIYHDKKSNHYIVQCCQNGIGSYEGIHKTLEEAFDKYKVIKEKIIKETATTEYINGNITKKCYEALLNYEVEITD